MFLVRFANVTCSLPKMMNKKLFLTLIHSLHPKFAASSLAPNSSQTQNKKIKCSLHEHLHRQLKELISVVPPGGDTQGRGGMF